MTAEQLNHVAAVASLLGLGAVTWVRLKAFACDIVFYRNNGWNLVLDSGSYLPFLEEMRSSSLFGSTPVGLLRLQIGAFYLVLAAIILYGVFHGIVGAGVVWLSAAHP